RAGDRRNDKPVVHCRPVPRPSGARIPAAAARRRCRQPADRRSHHDTTAIRSRSAAEGDVMSGTSPRSQWLAANGEFVAASVAWAGGVARGLGRDGPAGREAELLAQLDQLAEQMPPPALVSLAERTGLSRFERDVLLLCAAVELDPSIRVLCAAAHGSEAMPYP